MSPRALLAALLAFSPGSALAQEAGLGELAAALEQASEAADPYQAAIDRALLSTVRVRSPGGVCSGFFVAVADLPPGLPRLIVTNAHCLEGMATGGQARVGLYPQPDMPRSVGARLVAVGFNEDGKDIALLEPLELPRAPDGLPLWDRVRQVEWNAVLGDPRGLGFFASRGIVSATGRRVAYVYDAVLTDATVVPGNSGGPMINAWGDAIGLVDMTASNATRTGFALPARQVRAALAQYARVGHLRTGSLGVTVSEGAEGSGPAVAAVLPDDATPNALRVGDRIQSVDGLSLAALTPREAVHALLMAVKFKGPGESVVLSVRRGSRVRTVTRALAEVSPFLYSAPSNEGGVFQL